MPPSSNAIPNLETSPENRASDHRVTHVLKALAHPVRWALVEQLLEAQSSCCNDLCGCFSLSQSTISQHLGVLKKAGVINYEKKGNCSCFSVDQQVLSEATNRLQALAGFEPGHRS